MFEFISEREIETPFTKRGKLKGQRFLKGPIPLSMLAIANQCGGQAVALLVCIYHRRDLTRSLRGWVTLPADLMEQFGISRYAKARALKELETAGLIEVERELGHTARVRLIPAITGHDEPSLV